MQSAKIKTAKTISICAFVQNAYFRLHSAKRKTAKTISICAFVRYALFRINFHK